MIRLKSEFIELKGRYDQEVFKAWNKFSKNPENSYRDFLASDQFSRIADAYDARLGQIQKSNAELFRTSPREGAKPTTPAARLRGHRPLLRRLQHHNSVAPLKAHHASRAG